MITKILYSEYNSDGVMPDKRSSKLKQNCTLDEWMNDVPNNGNIYGTNMSGISTQLYYMHQD